jgi:hypothetical protein
MTDISISPEHVKKLSGPAMRVFFKIAERWKLSPAEQSILLGLDSVAIEVFAAWQSAPETVPFSHERLVRISNLLAIYKTLHFLLFSAVASETWIKAPNAALTFGGRSALNHMLSGDLIDIESVRGYLEAHFGGMDTPLVAPNDGLDRLLALE